MIDVHYASLTSQGVQHRVFYVVGHSSRYQPRPTGLNFGEQTTGTGVFPLVTNLQRAKLSFQICVILPNASLEGGDDKAVKLWEVCTGRCIKTLQCDGAVHSLAWNPNPSLTLLAVAV